MRHRIGLEAVAAVPPPLAHSKASLGTQPDHSYHAVGIAGRLDPGGPVGPVALHGVERHSVPFGRPQPKKPRIIHRMKLLIPRSQCVRVHRAFSGLIFLAQ